MATVIDFSSALGQRAAQRLNSERIIWLTTTDSQGAPQPRPVWFFWDGDTALIYSAADVHKLHHIARSSHVALHFDSDGLGGDIVVFMADAVVDADAPAADQFSAYVEKYTSGMKRIGMNPRQFAAAYPVAIRLFLRSLRGHF
ncbi:MAG: TIGR03667 family PPOX class F420-dependent oxidoreductase [Caldilineales bacterium]|nr:TIGR03667 family PPOX class F420-dependent oxidoreductase [Caldilineales bacterium]